MPLGPNPQLKSLAAGLNPTLFRLFVRDLLGERGFTELRDFDGVGDGGRDLEGLDPEGHPCVVQLKYREDPDAATSTYEFGELPLALIRLGRKHGLFITNGRITAPAKRDASNAYPGLALDFMEGVDLLEALDGAPVTAALWRSGAEIRHVQRQVRFGVVCRALPQDRATTLEQLRECVTAPNWDEAVGPGSIVAATVGRARFEYPDFEPFRPPSLITMSEGVMDAIRTNSITLRGDWTIDQLPVIQHAVGANVAKKWSAAAGSPEACSVRVSRPSVSSVDAAESVPADLKPITLVGRKGEAALERETILNSLGVWEKPSWIQTYQVMCGLYYLLWPAPDLLCKISYTTMVSRSELGMALRARAHFDRWWERSIFCFSKDRMTTDRECSDRVAPHFCYQLDNERWIVSWLHPRIQGGVTEPALSGDERDADYDPLQETPAEVAYIEAVLKHVNTLQLERVNPTAAYHANCFAAGGEAAPSVMWRTHGVGDLLDYMEEVPSPIDLFDIDCKYASVYLLPDPAAAKKAAEFCNDWRDKRWRIRAVHNPRLEEDYERFQFLAGSVNRALDEQVVLVTAHREDSPRSFLEQKLQDDSAELPDLFARLEQEGFLTKEMRASRRWLRDRWRVYYQPERPAPGDEQVCFVEEPSGAKPGVE